MRETENIRQVAALGVDMMGFIFWPESQRFVKMISAQAGIIPDYSEERLRKARGNSQTRLLPAQKTVQNVSASLWTKCHKALLPGCIITISIMSSCTATSRR